MNISEEIACFSPWDERVSESDIERFGQEIEKHVPLEVREFLTQCNGVSFVKEHIEISGEVIFSIFSLDVIRKTLERCKLFLPGFFLPIGETTCGLLGVDIERDEGPVYHLMFFDDWVEKQLEMRVLEESLEALLKKIVACYKNEKI